MLELHLFAQTLTADLTAPTFAGGSGESAKSDGPDPLEQAFHALHAAQESSSC